MILHVDMDAFYAAVEIRDNPRLAGLPVVVGESPHGRGVVSAASYEARKFGIHSAMPASQAIRLCSNAVFMKPRMEHYAAISKQIREIFFRFTSLVEPLSLDEAFLDVSGCTKLFGPAEQIARQIKQTILLEVGLVASAGVAPNKFLAKVASDLEKPDGLVVVDPDRIHEFLDPLPISKVWGIGKKTNERFRKIGIKTIGHIRQMPLSTLQQLFGVNSEHFYRLSRGEDTRSVVPDRIAKSISHETTFAADINDVGAIEAWLLELTDQVARRMRRYRIVAKTVQLKLRFPDFHTITRSHTLREPTDSTDELIAAARELLAKNSDMLCRGLRLLGMGVSNLVHDRPVQQTLFDQAEKQKLKKLDQTTDRIREKFGSPAVRRGTSLEHKIQHRRDPRVGD